METKIKDFGGHQFKAKEIAKGLVIAYCVHCGYASNVVARNCPKRWA